MIQNLITKLFGKPLNNLFSLMIFLSLVSSATAQEISADSTDKTQNIEKQATEKIEENSDSYAIKPDIKISDNIENPADSRLAKITGEETFRSRDFSPPKIFVQPQEKQIEADFFDADRKNNENESATQSSQIKRWEIPRGSIEYGVEVGYAPNIALWWSGTKPFNTDDHQHFITSLRWGRILGTKGIVTFSVAAEFTPLSLAIGNEVVNENYTPGSLTERPTKRETTYGFAAAVNFRFIFFPKYRLRPFLGSAIGPSYHLKPVPIPTGTKWNLLQDFQVGGQYMLSKTRAIHFGYRYYHLSNIYLSDFNPGYNTNMIFVGYSIFK